MISFKRVGGLRWLRIHRLTISWSIKSPSAVPKPTRFERRAKRDDYIARCRESAWNEGVKSGLNFGAPNASALGAAGLNGTITEAGQRWLDEERAV